MNKLIRDKIPAMALVRGEKIDYTRWANSQKVDYLGAKLVEEANEWKDDRNIEELADVLEVIYAIVEHTPGLFWEDLEKVREGKRIARGGFSEGYILTAPIPKYEERKKTKVKHTEACKPGFTDPECPVLTHCCGGGPLEYDGDCPCQ
jgi:predicted house-cleaning noncanonical NTP pyrophosphatase (MazG superfamily)